MPLHGVVLHLMVSCLNNFNSPGAPLATGFIQPGRGMGTGQGGPCSAALAPSLAGL